jgi:CheY-like chemotaxis protein
MTGHDLRGRRILVVEDSNIQAMEVCECLGAAGAVVLGPTTTSAEAELIIDANAVDCAVVDIDLGSGPSYELANSLKRRGLPFLFSSGYGEAAVPAEFSDIPLMAKPFSEEELIEAVEKLTRSEEGSF